MALSAPGLLLLFPVGRMHRMVRGAAVAASTLLVVLLCVARVCADEHTHRYRQGEEVVLWANKAGPYHNPSESYPFFSVPGCPPLHTRPLQTDSSSLGVLLEGDSLADTGISLPFRRAIHADKICDFTIDDPDVLLQLEYAVASHYWYQLVVDELPVYGMVGEFISADEMKLELAKAAAEASAAGQPPPSAPLSASAQGFIYTHRDFTISYNGDQIVEIDLTSENPRPLILGEMYPFTYSVSWKAAPGKSFEARFERYDGVADFVDHSVHWIALFNSFVMVVFLCGLVLLVLNRTIKADVINAAGGAGARLLDPESGRDSPPASPDTLDSSSVEEGRWRLLAGDVFRAPVHLQLYTVVLGSGVQLLLLLLAAVVLTLLASVSSSATGSKGDVDDSSNLLTVACLLIYALSSGAQGYVSGWYFKLHQAGPAALWKKVMLRSALFFPALLLCMVLCLNMTAWVQGSNPVLSAGTLVVLVLVWVCVAAPMHLAGTLWARSRTTSHAFPCRVNAIRRIIPAECTKEGGDGPPALLGAASPASSTSVYSSWWVLVLFSSILPFGSVFIELYFILVSGISWQYSSGYMLAFLLLVLLMLLVVAACVSIVATYLLLNGEDYRWHWLSFHIAAASGGYMLLYATYFFLFKTHMSGLLQTATFFSYTLLATSILTLSTASCSALVTRWFVCRIYSFTKSD